MFANVIKELLYLRLQCSRLCCFGPLVANSSQSVASLPQGLQNAYGVALVKKHGLGVPIWHAKLQLASTGSHLSSSDTKVIDYVAQFCLQVYRVHIHTMTRQLHYKVKHHGFAGYSPQTVTIVVSNREIHKFGKFVLEQLQEDLVEELTQS